MRSTLFTIFGLQIRSYGLMMAVGFALGIWRAVRVSRKRYGIEAERVYDLALVLLISGVVGARALYILLNPGSESWKDFPAVWQGGLSFHGGLALAMIAGYVYTRAAGLSYWKCADLVAPSAAIGYALTRVGCFLNGCCYGRPSDLPWAVRFIDANTGLPTPPSHPTQLYASLANVLIFWLLVKLERLNRKPGFVFVSYLGLYSIYRFLVEFLRSGVSAAPWALGLTQAQAISLPVCAVAAMLLATVYRRPAGC